MGHILVVDDEPAMLQLIRRVLEKDRHLVSLISDAQTALHMNFSKYDLILLDIMMPGLDGFEFCSQIRSYVDCPIIFLTAKIQEADIVRGLGLGADDYITKPFNIHILLAKVNSLLRRTNSNSEPKNKIDAKDFILNISNSTIIKDDKIIDLTKNEYKILKYFIENREKIVSREDIMDVLWENDCFVDDNTLSVNITRLRSKLEELGLKDIIETKRGQGYMLKGEK